MKAVIQDSLHFLSQRAMAKGEDVFRVANFLLFDPRFKEWSGSSKVNEHHFGTCGLINHTAEVVRLSDVMVQEFEDLYQIDKTTLFLACLFHDAGKMYDYERQGASWGSAPHKRYIHHISRSALIWQEASKKSSKIHKQYFESVLHCVLSHHTSREAGSPVAPKSREAWILTLCDNMSARMFDADTNDLIKK